MGISPEGMKLVLTGVIVSFLGFLLGTWVKWLGISVFSIGALFTLFSAYFFRDPERDRVFAPGEIASPADGTVLSVKTEGDPDTVVVRIFLSVFNVHIQRSPIDGKIEDVSYTKGKFAIAYKPEAAENERNRIKILGEQGLFAEVEQITGAIARRIACYVQEGQEVKAGEKIGMIYFGSQVALHLPTSVKMLVKPGNNVQAGETIIGIIGREVKIPGQDESFKIQKEVY
ncbi:MAG: phosphatidylserine decarboxylase [Elusimicrobia bacterium]|nr:phosphatidylserine decarboxylase [Elusimicrobiota bacterium]